MPVGVPFAAPGQGVVALQASVVVAHPQGAVSVLTTAFVGRPSLVLLPAVSAAASSQAPDPGQSQPYPERGSRPWQGRMSWETSLLEEQNEVPHASSQLAGRAHGEGLERPLVLV